MPSTFSPNLRLELPANGEQAGTWGSTTNRNLGTLVESAITGHSTVVVTSANQALTALAGVDDQARKAIITLTTTTTAGFAVYVPPTSKLYVVRNNTAYTATVYASTVIGNTTAAGAGVVIPAGGTMSIWTDGVAVGVQSNLHLGNVVGDVFGNATSATNAENAVNAENALNADTAAAVIDGVYTVGDQTIDGIKTLTSAPVVPDRAFTLAKLQDIAGATVLGRTAAGTGGVEELPIASFAPAAASETVAGVVELANATEAAAGTATDRAISPARLRTAFNATGAAPVFACRAWVNFDGVPLAGTYSQVGTTITVTMFLHGMQTGQVATLDFISGAAVDGSFPVTVTAASTFTVTAAVGATTSGNVVRQAFIRAGGNVGSIKHNGVGDYTVNFDTVMPDANYSVVITAGGTDLNPSANATASWAATYSSGAVRIRTSDNSTDAARDQETVNVAVFR
jgi:hypothetical protein